MKDNRTIGSTPNPACPVCGSSGSELFHNIPDRFHNSEGTWNLKQCINSKCLQIWLDPKPNENEIYKAYKNYYTHLEDNINILSFLKPFEESYISLKYGYKNDGNRIIKSLSKLIYLFPTEKVEIDFRYLYLNIKDGAKILDIGCGNGSFINRLLKKGWDAYGIDFDEKAVTFCKQKGLKVNHGDLLSQKYPDSTFDVVTLNHVIEHLFNPNEIIEECNRILKPKGKLVIATPNNKSWLFLNVFKKDWFPLDAPRHITLFNRNSLMALFKDKGFSIEFCMTTIRNDYYVYAASRVIKKKGFFEMGKEKPKKAHLIIGKLFQLFIWFYLIFKPDSGGEIIIKGIKDEGE